MEDSNDTFERDAVESFKLFTSAILLSLVISFLVAVGLSICGLGPSEYRGILICAGMLTLVTIYLPSDTKARLAVFKRLALGCAALGVAVPLVAVYVNGTVKSISAIYPLIGLLPFLGLYERYLGRLRTIVAQEE